MVAPVISGSSVVERSSHADAWWRPVTSVPSKLHAVGTMKYSTNRVQVALLVHDAGLV